MVVNAMIAAIAAHSRERGEFIYHIGSSVRNPVTFSSIEQCVLSYFLENPPVAKDGKTMKVKRIPAFSNMTLFRIYVTIRYRLPLEVMQRNNTSYI